MRNLDEQLKKKREEIYGPLIREFEEKVHDLNIPKNELDAVPGLFIPQFGELYANSLVRIAIVGKETYGWGSDHQQLSADVYDNDTGIQSQALLKDYFRTESPAEWRNNFWWYSLEPLASLYGLNTSDVLTKESPILKSIAWSNAHAVETYSSKGVSDKISREHMQEIQKIASEEGLADLDKFVECFSPQVILYLYRSNSDSDSKKFIDGADYVRSWGKDDILLEYNYKGVVILHSRHPSWMSRGNVSRETFASTVREALSSHKLFKVLPCTTCYNDLSEDSDDFKRFSKLLNDKAKVIPTTDNQSLAHELILAVAQELQKEQNSTMTARLLVTLLNHVQQFVDSKWIYSSNGRGPASVVRGTWSDLQNSGRAEDAEVVAMAFTSISGDYCYE